MQPGKEIRQHTAPQRTNSEQRSGGIPFALGHNATHVEPWNGSQPGAIVLPRWRPDEARPGNHQNVEGSILGQLPWRGAGKEQYARATSHGASVPPDEAGAWTKMAPIGTRF